MLVYFKVNESVLVRPILSITTFQAPYNQTINVTHTVQYITLANTLVLINISLGFSNNIVSAFPSEIGINYFIRITKSCNFNIK